jgi:hypothetical protein
VIQLRSNEGRGKRSGRRPLKKSPVVRLQKTALPSLQKKFLTNPCPCAIIRVQKEKEIKVMKYLVETRFYCEVLDTYGMAEIFCYERGIHPEEIVEITAEEAEEILG